MTETLFGGDIPKDSALLVFSVANGFRVEATYVTSYQAVGKSFNDYELLMEFLAEHFKDIQGEQVTG